MSEPMKPVRISIPAAERAEVAQQMVMDSIIVNVIAESLGVERSRVAWAVGRLQGELEQIKQQGRP